MKYDIIDALVDLVSAESKMPSVIITSYAAIEQINKLRAENDSLIALAKLGKWLMEKQAEPKFSELRYEEIEDTARDFGLLEQYLATEPCGDQCYCNTWALFPRTCVRLTDKAKVLEKRE